MKNDNKIEIDPKLAQQHGTTSDAHGWPTVASLQDWHEEHNPQDEPGLSVHIRMPVWFAPVAALVVAGIIFLIVR